MKPFTITVIGKRGPYLRIVKKGTSIRRRMREQSGLGWTSQQWQDLLDKHGRKCVHCGSENGLVPDHIIPLCRGGKHEICNIQPLCRRCNLKKGITIPAHLYPR